MINTIIALLISAGIPALFLILIYTLDFYASRTFRLVLISSAWGAIGGFTLSLLTNTFVAPHLARRLTLDPRFLLVVLIAPVVEEIIKSLFIFYISRQPEFTYFVDGAIYGFASGIGFSITENFLYVSQTPHIGIGLALTRSFSTCLMHGTATALVGAAVGRFRFKRLSRRRIALVGGWVAAILLHALFNGVAWTTLTTGTLGTLMSVVIGLMGAALIVIFILMGLREEREWLAETLNREVGVTPAERRAAQAYGDVEEILQPIVKQFPRQAEQVETMLLKQAQIGIKRKVQQQVDDPKLRARLNQEILEMQEEMERLRDEVGWGVMAYVRCVFPEGAADIWSCMQHLTVANDPEALERWEEMLRSDEEPTPDRNIFVSLGD